MEELKFSEFRKSFDAIVEKQEKPVRRKVQQDVFERTGLTFGYEQVGVFLKRARGLVDVDLRDEVPGAKGASGGSRHRESRPPAD
ncbi:hypothetical protein [Burkholderia multivorans]|uniref:hypothetical protein n=1 Tax=Burkholderia multivorans TaxID=87883 RepID=UPI00209DBDD0|nr:hypothetical protein [Burkholderia multivorans]